MTTDNLATLAAMMTVGDSLDPAVMRRTIDAYLASWTTGDVDARLACFTADAKLQDPAGAPEQVGHAALRAFFEAVEAIPQKREPRFEWMVPSGMECIFRFVMKSSGPGASTTEMPITEILKFSHEGRISDFKAFWTHDSMLPVS